MKRFAFTTGLNLSINIDGRIAKLERSSWKQQLSGRCFYRFNFEDDITVSVGRSGSDYYLESTSGITGRTWQTAPGSFTLRTAVAHYMFEIANIRYILKPHHSVGRFWTCPVRLNVHEDKRPITRKIATYMPVPHSSSVRGCVNDRLLPYVNELVTALFVISYGDGDSDSP